MKMGPSNGKCLFADPMYRTLTCRIQRVSMSGRQQTHAISFSFHEAVPHDGDTATKRVPRAIGTLLHNMHKFMAEKLLAFCRVGVVLTWSEIQVRAVCKGQRADRCGFGSDVDADIRETRFEARFHFLQDWTR